MLHLLLALSVYILAILWTFALMGALPVVLTQQLLERRRNGGGVVTLLAALLIGASYFVGGAIGWLLRASQWRMAFGETVAAAFNARKYGDAVEYQAERVLLYPLYMAVLCSIAVAGGAWLILRPRLRHRAAA